MKYVLSLQAILRVGADIDLVSFSSFVCPLGFCSLARLIFAGDVADDRFFNKLNGSDATQFSLLYPRIGAHCRSFHQASIFG